MVQSRTMSEEKTRVLVLGGTGHYGREIVSALSRRPAEVRVLSRSTDRAREVLGEGPELVRGDIERGEDVTAALDGVEALAIAVSAFSFKTIKLLDRIERDAVISVIDKAVEAGVKRVVFISVYEPRALVVSQLPLGPFANIAASKCAVEDHLAASGLSWTVFGCPPSMEIFFAFQRGPFLVVPGGGPPGLPTIASSDVGELAARALLRDDLDDRRFRVTGPKPISFPEAAQRIGSATGRRIRFVAAPLLPIRIMAALSSPFTPYLQYAKGAITLLNNFPSDLVDEIPADYQALRDTFDFIATPIEEVAHRRLQES